MPARKKTGRIKRKARPRRVADKSAPDVEMPPSHDAETVEEPDPDAYLPPHLSLTTADCELLLEYAGVDHTKNPAAAGQLVLAVDNFLFHSTFDHLIPTPTESRKVLTKIQKRAGELYKLLNDNPRVVDWNLKYAEGSEEGDSGEELGFGLTFRLARLKRLADDALNGLDAKTDQRGKFNRGAMWRDYCTEELVRLFRDLNRVAEDEAYQRGVRPGASSGPLTAHLLERCARFVAVALKARDAATPEWASLADPNEPFPQAQGSKFVRRVRELLLAAEKQPPESQPPG